MFVLMRVKIVTKYKNLVRKLYGTTLPRQSIPQIKVYHLLYPSYMIKNI